MIRMMILGLSLLVMACAAPGTKDPNSSTVFGWNSAPADAPQPGSAEAPTPPDLATLGLAYDLGTAPVAAVDLAAAPDLANPAQGGALGCHGFGLCVGSCDATSANQSAFDGCVSACGQSSVANQELGEVFVCGLNACASVGRCSSVNDLSQGCTLCAYAAVASTYGFSCAGDPLCNSAACASARNACAASLP